MSAERWLPHANPSRFVCFRLDMQHIVGTLPQETTERRLDSPLFHLVELVQVEPWDADKDINALSLDKPAHEDTRPGGSQFFIVARTQIAFVLADGRVPVFPGDTGNIEF